MRKYIIFAGLMLLGCSTPSSVAPVSFPLKYKTMVNPAEFPVLAPCSALSRVEVEDARAEKVIGKRFVEGKPSAAAAPVTASTDIDAWVRAGAEDALKRAGVSMAKVGGPVLRIVIDQISTSENVLHRAGYEGRIALSGELRSGGNGTSCWKARADGFAENYGYAGSAENYQETLNHALDRAIIRLLSTPELKRSICSCGGA